MIAAYDLWVEEAILETLVEIADIFKWKGFTKEEAFWLAFKEANFDFAFNISFFVLLQFLIEILIFVRVLAIACSTISFLVVYYLRGGFF